MTDIVNELVNIAQQELVKHAQRLDRLVASMNAVDFDPGVESVQSVREMIENQSKLYDVVFDMLKTALEQHRNLMLAMGTMNQSVQQDINATTDSIDAMLHALEQMSKAAIESIDLTLSTLEKMSR
ncbi:MAG: hypothetical protein E7011_03275 [Alphaproteobacteria bacterium]|nr:hypothetical protein [Alphaproteobacteria bacterium]